MHYIIYTKDPVPCFGILIWYAHIALFPFSPSSTIELHFYQGRQKSFLPSNLSTCLTLSPFATLKKSKTSLLKCLNPGPESEYNHSFPMLDWFFQTCLRLYMHRASLLVKADIFAVVLFHANCAHQYGLMKKRTCEYAQI